MEAFMKPTVFFILAAVLAAGCTKAAPTSPTVVNASTAVDSVQLDGKASLQKVHLYFYDFSDADPFFSATNRIVGLAVTVSGATSPYTVLGTGQTGNQGDVTFWIPDSYSSIAVWNGNSGLDGTVYDCYQSTTRVLDLPLRGTENSIHIFHSTDTYPNCH
jgi:hypothetical protein